MKEVADLTALQNKRCKNATETSLIFLGLDRRRKVNAEIGGHGPSNDTLVSVLWVSMDAGSRSHVSGKLNVAEATYVDLRAALMQYISLSVATSGSSSNSRSSMAMDVSAIASVAADDAGCVSPPAFTDEQNPDTPAASQPLWSVNEAGWPIDEEGWEIDGYIDEQLNFVKG